MFYVNPHDIVQIKGIYLPFQGVPFPIVLFQIPVHIIHFLSHYFSLIFFVVCILALTCLGMMFDDFVCSV